MLAAASGFFVEARGVELLRCLSAIGEVLIDDYNSASMWSRVPGMEAKHSNECLNEDIASISQTNARGCSAQIVTADFFVDKRWISADFVYTCTIMFTDDTMQQLAALAQGMRPGALFATVRAFTFSS
eukprot:SAG31_NODE_2688_length_5250_cov_11.245583_5_plen_128_part_00